MGPDHPRPAGVRAVPWLALAAFAAALWPHWRWAAARLGDGSDDPLGLVALLVLGLVVARFGARLREAPRAGALVLACSLVLLATALGAVAPPLVAALVAALAMAAAIASFAPRGTPTLPIAGLAALALPVVSSLQFYAGYPLRVVTAEASRWLLVASGFDAAREGHAMRVDGHLVIVDAPCSGVQLAWFAWFTACAVAAWRGLPDRALARRLPWVGVTMLAGNVVRNAWLVGLEARGTPAAGWLHEGLGLAVLAAVCGAVAWLVVRADRVAPRVPGRRPAPSCHPERSGGSRRLRLPVVFARRDRAGAAPMSAALALCALCTLCTLCTLCALCALAPWVWPRGAVAAPATAAMAPIEWPRTWDGRTLRPLALGAVEARFAARFPGRIERLTDEHSVLVWRAVRTPTRMLHPASDCYRGLGYRIAEARLERDAQSRLWRCFVAERDGRRIRVCERIEDAAGIGYTDTSSWFWAAQLGRSTGPWQAVTVATPLGSGA